MDGKRPRTDMFISVEELDSNLIYGIPVLISIKITKSILDFLPLSNRVMIMKFQTINLTKKLESSITA